MELDICAVVAVGNALNLDLQIVPESIQLEYNGVILKDNICPKCKRVAISLNNTKISVKFHCNIRHKTGPSNASNRIVRLYWTDMTTNTHNCVQVLIFANRGRKRKIAGIRKITNTD